MNFLQSLKEKKPLPVGGNLTAGSVSFFNNGVANGEDSFISTQGLVTSAGWRPGDPSLYLMPGHILVILPPGSDGHSVYLVDEETKTSYPEEAFLLVALERELGMGSNNAAKLKERLLAGEGQVISSLKYQEVNGQPQLLGEMPFPTGEVFPITILSASQTEVERAQKEGKQARVLWLSMTHQMIKACQVPDEESAPAQDALAIKTGEAEAPPAAPEGEEAEKPKKKKTAVKVQQPTGVLPPF